jgi:tetratricopeptide (TPR) repeat protein
MRRSVLVLVFIAQLLFLSNASPVQAKDTWTSVRSKNFFLVGNASEKDIRKVGQRLEQFRYVLSVLLSKANLNSAVPTTVVVFKDMGNYSKFGPPATAGYFQPGQDMNYIAVSAEMSGEHPFSTIFHEFTHLIVNNNYRNVPVWFNEGLAEFYSTFDITDGDKKVYLGRPISDHVYLLRSNKMLPLQTLFSVDHDSPYYNEKSKKGVFYAQSWALIHYLINGDQGKHNPQLGQFITLVNSGRDLDSAFTTAFQTDYAALEKTLADYIKRDSYYTKVDTFYEKLDFDKNSTSSLLTDADAQFYQGDLLLHAHQIERAEKFLKQAIAIDPASPRANASLGLLEMYRGNFTEAKKYLERAADGSSNAAIHYNYALVLSRESSGNGGVVRGFLPDLAAKMRSELKKAIELAPDFVGSYGLLAFVNNVTGEEIDETIELLKHAAALAPGELELSYQLGQLYLRKQDFKAAKEALDQILRSNNADPQILEHTKSLLAMIDSMTSTASEMTLRRTPASAPSPKTPEPVEVPSEPKPQPVTPETKTDPFEYLKEALRKLQSGESRVQGTFERVECTGGDEAILSFKVGDRLFRLRTADLPSVDFTSYAEGIGAEVKCGVRKPTENVIITYRPNSDEKKKIDGEIVAVEFVPKGFVLDK